MQKKNRGMIIAFVVPALLFFVATFVYPIIRTIMMSFYKIDNVTASMSEWTFTGLSNYTKLLSTPVFITSCTNLLKIWLIGGIIVMSLALLFAVILSSGIKGKKFFRAVIYLPNIVSAVALAIMWQQYVYSNQYGLLKPIADALGFQWLDTEHKFLALLLAYCFGMVGYHMLIFLSGIESIGTQYFEASTIDGANKIKQFRYITLPLLKGCFKTNITMWSISSAGFFLWSQLFASVTTDTTVITPMVYLYMQTFGAGNTVTERNAGLGAAIGILLAIFVVLVFWICNNLFKNDDLELSRTLAKEARLLPGYVIVTAWVLFTFILLGWVLCASMSTTPEIFAGQVGKFPSGLHFENFTKAWGSQNVSKIFMNSLGYSIISCAFLVVICAPCAYVLSRFKFIGNKAIQSGFVAAMGVPVAMIVLPLFCIIAQMHLVDNGIRNRLVLLFLYIGINIPYTTIFLLNFFANLSRSFEEAAEIDGCPPIKIFWKIMFPMAQPGIITVTIFNFINIWNEYFLSLIFANSDKMRPVAVGLYSMINSMKYTGDWSGMFAAVVIVFLPTFFLYIFLSEKIIAGVTAGGVKG